MISYSVSLTLRIKYFFFLYMMPKQSYDFFLLIEPGKFDFDYT